MKYSAVLASGATVVAAQNASQGCVDLPKPVANLTFEATINVDVAYRYQTMIGGGCSGAFGAACTTNTLSAANQNAVVEMLFSENYGGLTVLRNLIGSSPGSTILPKVPATPCGPFNYTSFASINQDSCQLTLAQTARTYSPDLYIYADAWSAPGGFKTTGKEAGGGYICGVRGTNCTYDWREAYANYLVQYVKMYQQQNFRVSLLGAYNEPDFNPLTYSAMLTDGYQAYDFLSVLYPIAKKAFPELNISCCDATGARQQRDLLTELNRLGGGKFFDVNTYHNYQSDIKRPFSDLLPYGQPTLETEWSDGGSTWTATWDLQGNNFEGLQWAVYMNNAFKNNVAGWLNWWCTWNGPDAPLILVNGTDYFVSARVYAFSGYFRFARPGAVRIEADSSVEEVYVTAWQNTNGTIAVPVVNMGHNAYTVTMNLAGTGVNHAVAYLSDNSHNVSAVDDFTFENGAFVATVEPRAMKTFFLDNC
ncbi:hypothetical protein LTR62_004770 [Meristemomyces frigidus]|uniref:Glycoside hydrolase family 30 protein n=1 Tax=Meristemomyces frigidus TaxID=1508187 RepID=A0AAN7TF65_9PEZI|nr:hypothetical protein LTR62_004770 [Meristemomyces frigidus]